MTAPSRGRETEFEPIYHNYGPHRVGLPPLVPYFRELWHRRPFATEMSKATMRGANTSTFFGQAWLVLNPLLLAAIYYVLVTIIRGRHEPAFFPHLTLAIFAFTFVSTSATSGSTSVTGSGKLLINTAFPRLLIPLAAVRTAFFRFLPTVPVYMVIHLIFLPVSTWHPRMFLAGYFLGTMIVFGMGLAAFFAALQVYFRDTAQFLPFFVRIWMYLSPVLWLPTDVDGSATVDANAHRTQSHVRHARRLRGADAGRKDPAAVHVDRVRRVGDHRRDHRLPLLHLKGA